MTVFIRGLATIWLLLVLISCDTKLPDGVQACSDKINTNCYVKIANKKDCFIHLDTYAGENDFEWSGVCVNHLAKDHGVLLYKRSDSQVITLIGEMSKGKFVGKRDMLIEDFFQKCSGKGVVTDQLMTMRIDCKNGTFGLTKYIKSTECQKPYIKCWKGTLSRHESDNKDDMYFVGYLRDPKPYKGKSIMSGVLYWNNTCAKVVWKNGKPYPEKKLVPPLIDAVKKLQYSRVKSLLADNHPVDFPDKNGQTPLMYAVSKKGMLSEVITALFLQHGADIKKKDKNGKTVYDYVTKKGYAGNFITMLNDARDGTNSFFNSMEEFKKANGDLSRLPEIRKKEKEAEKAKKKSQ